MMTSTMIFILSAMCLVGCTFVAGEISGISGTGSDPAVNPTEQQQQAAPLPDGYVAHPDVGFAYKLHRLLVTWTEANNRCIQEGAQLAVIDSPKKVEYVISQMHFWIYAHVGIIRSPHDNGTWVAASTGLQLSSLPWIASEPGLHDNCACVNSRRRGLDTLNCGTGTNFVCEIPIPKNIAAAN